MGSAFPEVDGLLAIYGSKALRLEGTFRIRELSSQRYMYKYASYTSVLFARIPVRPDCCLEVEC